MTVEQFPLVDEKRRLLVIDDDSVQRRIISKLGAQVGFEVTAAATFEDAEVALKSSRYDCITLDLSLGSESGALLLETVQATGNLAPVIVVSGAEPIVLDETVGIARSLRLDAQFMCKPLDLVELRARLSKKYGSAFAVRGNIEVGRSLKKNQDLLGRISSIVRAGL